MPYTLSFFDVMHNIVWEICVRRRFLKGSFSLLFPENYIYCSVAKYGSVFETKDFVPRKFEQ